MRKRLLLSAGMLAGVVCVALAFAATLPVPQPRAGVTKANFDRIDSSMTRTDVENLLGQKFTSDGIKIRHMAVYTCCIWRGDDGAIASITFSPAGLVYSRNWIESTETMVDKLRRWFGL